MHHILLQYFIFFCAEKYGGEGLARSVSYKWSSWVQISHVLRNKKPLHPTDSKLTDGGKSHFGGTVYCTYIWISALGMGEMVEGR